MFALIMNTCIVVITLSLLIGLAALILTKDELSRAVMADLVFYGMVSIYFIWTLTHDSSIGYEVAVLAGLVCGAIPTMSMARIISRGRR